ncbi:hypothetical protein D068_cds05860 [Bacillus atrophaeus UCMB-5137]|nr:hypothetical protein D068_cds05860 [Bacillus atrophaeus UCMB-5137]
MNLILFTNSTFLKTKTGRNLLYNEGYVIFNKDTLEKRV